MEHVDDNVFVFTLLKICNLCNYFFIFIYVIFIWISEKERA